jgi:group II intron reverse transcriptase/maturase
LNFESCYTPSSLTRKLTDMDNLLTGWRKVRDNQGCAGADGVSIEQFGHALKCNLTLLAAEISRRTYRPFPLLKILVDKGKGDRESRVLSIPAVRDRVAQASALNILEPLFEAEFEHCSFAYRKGHSWQQAVQKVRDYYDEGYRWVLDADIDAFFDSVPHARLLDKVKHIVLDEDINCLISLWVKAEVWDGTKIANLAKGIPQGSAISPTLANLYLDELDEQLLAQGIRLVRYADDFVILCKTREKVEAATQLTEGILKQMELCLDESNIISFEQGFKFLGVIFLHSDAPIPFGKEKKPKKVNYVPPPLNLKAYHAGLYPRQSTGRQ